MTSRRKQFDSTTLKPLLANLFSSVEEGTICFRFLDASLNTKIMVSGGRVIDTSADFLPEWGEMLVPHHVSPQLYATQLADWKWPVSAINHLHAEGQLSDGLLCDLLRQRLGLALQSVARQPKGSYSVIDRTTRYGAVGSGLPLPEAQQLARSLVGGMPQSQAVPAPSSALASAP